MTFDDLDVKDGKMSKDNMKKFLTDAKEQLNLAIPLKVYLTDKFINDRKQFNFLMINSKKYDYTAITKRCRIIDSDIDGQIVNKIQDIFISDNTFDELVEKANNSFLVVIINISNMYCQNFHVHFTLTYGRIWLST